MFAVYTLSIAENVELREKAAMLRCWTSTADPGFKRKHSSFLSHCGPQGIIQAIGFSM